MKYPYNKDQQFDTAVFEGGANQTLLLTVTPASGEVAVISQIAVTSDEVPSGSAYVTIHLGATVLWEAWLRTKGGIRETWREGLSGHVVDGAMGIDVAIISETGKSCVSVTKDRSTTVALAV